MAFQRIRPLAVLLGLSSLASLATASSINMAYCASILTVDSSTANSSTYQSDGLCYDFCESDYAFAIVQEKNCWCSNYAPDSGDQVDTSECNTECPGYPSDTCGGDGLYGYMQLSKAAVGTKGGDSTTAAATATQATVTGTVQTTATVSTTTKSSSTTSKSPGSTGTATADGTSAISPTTYVSTITQGGSVSLQTVTVMPTAAGTSESSAANISTSQKGLSTGAAVGIAVGVLGFFVIVIAVGVFFWFRRKKRNEQEASMLEHQNSFRGSSAGMMSTPRTEMASVWEGEAQSVGRRSSRLMPHDPRMDPYAPNIYGRFDNKSHESVNTLRDDQDYSRRVLRTTNPDPTAGE